ncbi:MAG: hypothetical protein ABIJ34_08700 [archaeon]
MNFSNIKEAYKKSSTWFVSLISALLIGALMFTFTHFEQIYWNMGALIAYSQIISQIILSALFGINVGLLYFKLNDSATFSAKDAHGTSIGAILGIVVSGCPACGITIASYFGLATVIASLPFFGIELKVIGILVLLYSINSLSEKLMLCQRKIK